MLSKEEKELYYVLYGNGGSFKTALFELICKADWNNQLKLSLGFPEFVRVVKRYLEEDGYWENIQKEMSTKGI